MPVLIALLTLPIGILVTIAASILQTAIDQPAMWTQFILNDVTRGAMNGIVTLTPVTLVGFPLAYCAMRPLTGPWRFALVAAVLVVVAVVLEGAALRAIAGSGEPIYRPLLSATHMAPRLAGAVAAALMFASIVRWWWNAAPPSGTVG